MHPYGVICSEFFLTFYNSYFMVVKRNYEKYKFGSTMQVFQKSTGKGLRYSIEESFQEALKSADRLMKWQIILKHVTVQRKSRK